MLLHGAHWLEDLATSGLYIEKGSLSHKLSIGYGDGGYKVLTRARRQRLAG